MNLFSLFIIAGMILWLVKPLRVIVAQRTNRTVKALLVAFPVAYALTLGYRFFWGDREGHQERLHRAVGALGDDHPQRLDQPEDHP
ncbi:MAG: hypothetical protein EBS89_08305, partial [Proteobacteria bacterium]|nr:hypothetical protein [Pseudomonadota bacterium]